MNSFKDLSYAVHNGKLKLTKFGIFDQIESSMAEVNIAGNNKDSHMGSKMANSSEGKLLKFIDVQCDLDTIQFIQESPSVRVITSIKTYDDTNAMRISTQVTNITSEPITLEEVSSFVLSGFGDKLMADEYFLTDFLQSHHAECQPKRHSFQELGLCGGRSDSQQRAGRFNIGSWSTKEALPMGMIELSEDQFIMFQIESNNSWYYEISDLAAKYYLYLGGPNSTFGSWYKTLQPNESYQTPYVSICFGKDLNDVIGQMTLYRRHISGNCPADRKLPTIFNEYMHLSWDSPTAVNTAKYASVVAKAGVEYYVIDCGWHNEEDGDKVYPYVGHWLESKKRFPEGVRKTTDYIRSLGMKPGLWIEPEIIGYHCQQMLDHYDDNCFFQRHGKRITVMNRHFLDFRNRKVREYLTETIDRMIKEYGAEYIKCDYNQDCGVGTDLGNISPGAGLEDASNAFLSWITEMMKKHPNVVFEGCSSGGMRMDYKTLSAYSLLSTSDQTDYRLYPYIAGNILSAVLPEQAAVWSYPVTEDCLTDKDVTDSRITMNMINSFLGRMHLASHLERLNDHQMDLIREGVAYYNSLTPVKKRALPYFPLGFTGFDAPYVAAGLKNENKIYLAVWNLKGDRFIHIPFPNGLSNAKIAYPTVTDTHICINDRGLDVIIPNCPDAVFLEIEV